MDFEETALKLDSAGVDNPISFRQLLSNFDSARHFLGLSLSMGFEDVDAATH